MNPTTLASLGAPAGLAAGGLLGNLSDAFSAPRRALWSLLGLPDSGAELIANGLGGPGSDYVNHPLVKALGTGAEMVLDPMNLLMMPLGGFLGKAAGEFATAAKARTATEALQGVNDLRNLRSAEEFAGTVKGLGSPETLSLAHLPGGASHYYPVAQPNALGLFPSEVENMAQRGQQALSNFAGGEETAFGIGQQARAALAADNVRESAARLLPLRREVTALKDVQSQIGKPLVPGRDLFKGPSFADPAVDNPLGGYLQSGHTRTNAAGKGVNTLGRPVGATELGTQTATAQRATQLRQTMSEANWLKSELANQFSSLEGLFNPQSRSTVTFRNASEPALTARHEMSHALVNRAMVNDVIGDLPGPLQRAAAHLRGSNSGTLQGAGFLTDELAARAAEDPSVARQAIAAFLDKPHEAYASRIEQLSPLIAQIYRERMIPRLPYAAGAAAATIPVGAGLYYLADKLSGTR